MREKLIELIGDIPFTDEYSNYNSFEWAEHFADHLLANGVIVPPVKVGDTVYMPWEWNGTKGVGILEVIRIVDDNFTKSSPYVNTNFFTDDEDYWVAYNCGRFAFNDFGKTVFLTREEAEKALKERSEQ